MTIYLLVALAFLVHVGFAGSRLAVIPRAGHMSPIEQPEGVQAAMRDWAAA